MLPFFTILSNISCAFLSVDLQLTILAAVSVIGGRVRRLVYQEATGCALVLSDDKGGASWLHLIHASSLTQVILSQPPQFGFPMSRQRL